MTAPAAAAPRSVALIILTAAVALSPLLPLSGFSRFDVIQTALAVAVLTMAAAAAVFEPLRANMRAASGRIAWLLIALAVFVVARSLTGGQLAIADHLAAATPILLALSAATLVLWRLSRRADVPLLLTASVALPITVNLALAIAQRAGFSIPPPIPLATLDTPLARGLFDDPGALATWSALAMAALLPAMSHPSPRWRYAASALGLAAATCIGLAGNPTIAIASAVGVLFTVVVAITRQGVAAPRMVAPILAVVVATGLALAAAAPMTSVPDIDEGSGVQPADLLNEPAFDIALRSTFNGNATPLEGQLPTNTIRQAVIAYAMDAVWAGHGPAGFLLTGNLFFREPTETARFANGMPPTQRTPYPVLQLTGDLGLPWVFVFLSCLVALVVTCMRRPDEQGENHTCALPLLAALPLIGVGTGLLTGPAALLFGVIAGVAGVAPSSTQATQAEDTRRISTPAILLTAAMLALSWFHVRAAQWSFESARSIQWLQHGVVETGALLASHASTIQTRYESELNAGVGHAWNTGESRDKQVAVDHLLRAAQLSPASATARYELANLYIRSASELLPQDLPEDARRQQPIELLASALRIDSNLVPAAVMLAQTQVMDSRPDEAASILTPLSNRDLPRRELFLVLTELGSIYADLSESPEAALPFFERALPLAASVNQQRAIHQYLNMLRTWIETGTRPPIGESPVEAGVEQDRRNREQQEHDHEGHDHGDHNINQGVRDLYGPGGPDEEPASGSHPQHGSGQVPDAHDHPEGHDHDHHDDHDHEGHDHPPAQGSGESP